MPNIYEIVCHYDKKNRKIYNRIAQRLHSERKAHGYTQAELGKEIGCSRQRVASWEEGWNDEESYPEHLPEICHLVKLCSLYDCEPGYLLCEYDEKKRKLTDVSTITGLYSESISVLEEMTEAGLKHAHSSDIPHTVKLAFVNYIICNISQFSEALISSVFSSYILQLEELLESDSNSKIITHAFESSILSPNSEYKHPHPSDYTDTSTIRDSFVAQLIEDFQEHGFDYDDAVNTAIDASRYLIVLLSMKQNLEPKIDKHHFLFEISKVAEEFIDNCYSYIEESKTFLKDKVDYLNMLSDFDVDSRSSDINGEIEKKIE